MNWHDLLDLASPLFMAGIAWATIRFQGREIQKLQISDERQDKQLELHEKVLVKEGFMEPR